MKIVAMEEAFSVPGMATTGAALHQPSPFRSAVLKYWEQRLPDFTEYRLKDMDDNDVDVQVLSLTSPGVQMQPDAAIAVADAQLANDVLAATIKENPTRFAGLAAMPLQDPAAAVRELERAVTELGLSGVLINGHILDTYLDEPQYRLFWEALVGHNVPLYLHPNSVALGWSVFEGRPELLGPSYAWAAPVADHHCRPRPVRHRLSAGRTDRHRANIAALDATPALTDTELADLAATALRLFPNLHGRLSRTATFH
jgi:2,3-dihydroxybenzoate decarboxylase